MEEGRRLTGAAKSVGSAIVRTRKRIAPQQAASALLTVSSEKPYVGGERARKTAEDIPKPEVVIEEKDLLRGPDYPSRVLEQTSAPKARAAITGKKRRYIVAHHAHRGCPSLNESFLAFIFAFVFLVFRSEEEKNIRLQRRLDEQPNTNAKKSFLIREIKRMKGKNGHR